MSKLKKIHFSDILGIFKFMLVFFPALFYKLYLKISRKKMWLICETEKTARDNGFVMFKYLCEQHKEIKTFYAIDKKCNDYMKVKTLGEVIQWGSLKHYFIYMSAEKNLISHKNGSPNHPLFTLLHTYLGLYNNRVFLQHGVLYQNHSMFHKKNTKFKIFICGAKGEYEFVKEKYGYDNEVKYTGLARFDNLHGVSYDENMILYMPTWRRWLTDSELLKKSLYYKKIESLINSHDLEMLLKKYNKTLCFCTHGGFRDLPGVFECSNSMVKVIDVNNADIQQLLINGAVLITDYSSIHTDFAYMKKPIIYYQYDVDEFKQKHIGPAADDTYYDYKIDGFGKVVDNENDLLQELEKIILNNFETEERFLKKIETFFELYDNKNCDRIYEVIINDK